MKAWILRHGQTGEVSELKRLDSEHVTLTVGNCHYRAALSGIQEGHGHLVVIDGVLLPHGLPRSARSLPYQMAAHSEIITHQEFWLGGHDDPQLLNAFSPEAKVRRHPGLPHGAKLWLSSTHDDYHRTADGILTVSFARWFLWLQKSDGGKRAFFFRYKPVSLERQYVCIESHTNEVNFLTQNHW